VLPIHGAAERAFFPDVLKLDRDALRALQLRWRAERAPREKVAYEQALCHPLGQLTLYLGDGKRRKPKDSFTITVGRDKLRLPKALTLWVLGEAYKCGYGVYLDSISWPGSKWIRLKAQALLHAQTLLFAC